MKRGLLTLAAVVLAVSTLVGASGADGTSQDDEGAMALSRKISRTYSSGVAGGTTVSISDHGNIVQFESPVTRKGGFEHIGVGAFSEGYVLCYGEEVVRAFDTGSSERGFGPSHVSDRPFSISRSTEDGKLKLVQTFVFDPKDREFLITMSVKNRTGRTITDIVLRRQVDFDVDTGAELGYAGFENNFAATSQTVMAWVDPQDAPDPTSAHGMLLRSGGGSLGTPAVTAGILDNRCKPRTVPGISRNQDYGASMAFAFGELSARSSRSVTVSYVRI